MNDLMENNPFFEPYRTPHKTVPFHRIRLEHYEPAIREGIKRQDKEVARIAENTEAPTFANTIEAYERSGALLDRVTTVFGNMLSAETCDELQELAQKMSPLLSEHSNNITLNEKLFARIKDVYEQKDSLPLTPEQKTLLNNTYDGFVRHGANLTGETRKRYRELTGELSLLTLTFGENVLKDTNRFQLQLTDPADLSGLPETVVESAAEAMCPS